MMSETFFFWMNAILKFYDEPDESMKRIKDFVY